MNKLTLIYNNPDPSAGGIPRYGHRVLNGLEEKGTDFAEADFSELERGTVQDKVLNLLFRRKLFIRRESGKTGEVNHFLQPEIYFPTEGEDIVTVHDLYQMRQWEPETVYGKVKKSLYRRRLDRVKENADRVIAISTLTKSELIDEGFNEDKIDVVSLGVREKFKPGKKFSEREYRIGYIGDYIPRKRVGKMLEDFQNSGLERFEVELGGSGGSKEGLLKQEHSDREDVNFEGRIPEEELVSWYSNLKAFVFPSELEGFGLPILESTACGTPVFIYEDAKIPEEVAEYCFKIETLDEIPRKLEELDPETLEENASKVKKEFSWEKTVRKTTEIYEEYGE
jgi:glycosyltransferase involved in cell wall biosynthesis